MIDRASTFADPKIIDALKSQLVAVAIDQAYQRRQEDAEGDFYRRIAQQGRPTSSRGETTQGLYIATPDGELLGYTNNRSVDRVNRMIQSALETYQPKTVRTVDPGKRDPQWNVEPPEGGLVIRVQAKVLGGYRSPEDPFEEAFQTALSRDNFWISREEHQALIHGQLADSMLRRMARYHLVDNTRGEPPMWRPDEIRSIDVTLKDGRLSGTVRLATADGSRAFDAHILGVVEVTDDGVSRFDAVAKGEFEGEGRYTRGAPKGRFPFAVSFTLADGTDLADPIPPQGSRGWLRGYMVESR